MIEIKYGSIFDSKCDFIVNTTNSIGVMGKGLAKEFINRFPIICSEYNSWSKNNNRQKPYKLLPIKVYGHIIMFPTKIEWWKPSDYSYLHFGLDQLLKQLPEESSIAFPLLGASNGGLDKNKVIDIIKEKMKDHKSLVEIWIWEPKKKDTMATLPL